MTTRQNAIMGQLESNIIQNVSHELRTPLNIILSVSDLMNQGYFGVLAPEQKDAVVTIVTHVKQLNHLVEQLGILMEIDEGTYEGYEEPLDFTEIVAHVIEEKTAAFEDANLFLNTEIGSQTLAVLGHAHHLEEAVACLLDNALKFTPQDGSVYVRLQANDDEVILEVEDTGIGIPEGETEKIFSRFYQIDDSITRQYGGIGLGLSLVKSVVQNHEGEIKVTSQVGQGSRFTLKLPKLSKEKIDQVPSIYQQPQRRILVVDDEKNVTMFLKDGLEALPNCTVDVAHDGEEALEILKKDSFDLMFTDYKMPGIDGMSLAERVREVYPEIKIIMITAYYNQELLEEAQTSIRHILEKPVKLAEIRNIVQETLEHLESK
jgi:CheY-like chemotaxis protein/two-component sensor histidine kinase